jgi:TRAP-type C4-dicarboxylate transport system substrate-binding protein
MLPCCAAANLSREPRRGKPIRRRLAPVAAAASIAAQSIEGDIMSLRFPTAVAGAFSLLCAAAASAQTIEWKFNNNYAPTRPESAHIRAFARDLETATGARFKITVLEGGAMNLRDADALRWMTIGTPEIAFNWPPFLGRDAPELANLYVYGSVSTAAEHLKALPALEQILTEGYNKAKIGVAGFMGLPIIDATLFCRQPVRTLDELKRVKLRVGTREQVETFKALGVAAQIVPQNELYSALQTGVIDCALYAARFAQSVSLQEVAKHATYTGFPFPPVPYVIMVNQAKHAALPADMKAALAAATARLKTASTDFSKDAAAEKDAREKLRAAGVTWHPDLSAGDQEAIRKASLATWTTIAGEAGATAVATRERILKALGRSD